MRRPELEALWEPLVAAVQSAPPEQTYRALLGALRQLARELGRPCPVPTREERRAERQGTPLT